MKQVVVLIIIAILIIAVITLQPKKSSNNLTTPFSSSSENPTPTLQQFQFDSSTDLKKELDSINPQVLDNDFV